MDAKEAILNEGRLAPQSKEIGACSLTSKFALLNNPCGICSQELHGATKLIDSQPTTKSCNANAPGQNSPIPVAWQHKSPIASNSSLNTKYSSVLRYINGRCVGPLSQSFGLGVVKGGWPATVSAALDPGAVRRREERSGLAGAADCLAAAGAVTTPVYSLLPTTDASFTSDRCIAASCWRWARWWRRRQGAGAVRGRGQRGRSAPPTAQNARSGSACARSDACPRRPPGGPCPSRTATDSHWPTTSTRRSTCGTRSRRASTSGRGRG